MTPIHTLNNLTPGQRVVLQIIRMGTVDWGACSRTFADYDIYRFGARILELRRMGWTIDKEVCRDPAHGHRRVIWAYKLGSPK